MIHGDLHDPVAGVPAAGLLLGAAIRRGQRLRDEGLLDEARHLAAQRAAELARIERLLLAREAIITDLFDHSEALNREIDQLRARLEACPARPVA